MDPDPVSVMSTWFGIRIPNIKIVIEASMMHGNNEDSKNVEYFLMLNVLYVLYYVDNVHYNHNVHWFKKVKHETYSATFSLRR